MVGVFYDVISVDMETVSNFMFDMTAAGHREEENIFRIRSITGLEYLVECGYLTRVSPVTVIDNFPERQM